MAAMNARRAVVGASGGDNPTITILPADIKNTRVAATRYAKTAAAYLAICQLRAIARAGQGSLTTRPD